MKRYVCMFTLMATGSAFFPGHASAFNTGAPAHPRQCGWDYDGDGEDETFQFSNLLGQGVLIGVDTDKDGDYDMFLYGEHTGAASVNTLDIDGDGELELAIYDPTPANGGQDADYDGDLDFLVF